MQNGDIYTEFNEKSAKYIKLSKVIAENEHLLEWGRKEVVMDAGCGPGDVTVNVVLPILPADFELLLGVDISAKMTKHGLMHHGNERITFETLDIGQDMTDFLKNKIYSQGFSKIFSFYVMNWVKDLEKGVSNLYNLLKPGGQALLMFPVNRNFQKTYKTISTREPWAQYFKDTTRTISPYLIGDDPCSEFQEILSKVGFEIAKCETQHHYDEFATLQVLKDLIESLDQHISCVPTNMRAEYLDACVEVMNEIKAVRMEDKKVLLTADELVTVIRRPFV